jgi:superfamily II DNA or RNA helicase
MIRIDLKGSTARITGEGVLRAHIEKALTFRMPGYIFAPSYKAGHWDGNKCFFKKGELFPVGFLSRVLEIHPEAKVYRKDPVVDVEALTKYMKKANFTDDARDYQYHAVRSALIEKLGIIKLATNAGKSRCIAGIVAGMPQTNFLILSNRTDVLVEIEKELDAFVETNNYELATFQKAKNYELDEFTGVLVDECAAVAAKTFYDVVGRTHNADIRIGFSATPHRSDGKDFYIEAAMGVVVASIEQQELIKRGISVAPKIHIVPFNVEFLQGETYANAEDKLIDSKVRNKLIASLAEGKKECVILFKRRKHGKAIQALIPGSRYIDGTASAVYRAKTKKDFIEGKIDCLIASNIFDTGINLPNIKTLILAWAGKSEHGLTQKIGRAVRSFEGKDSVDIFVFYEKGNKYFNKHSKIRFNKLIEDGYDVEIYNGNDRF